MTTIHSSCLVTTRPFKCRKKSVRNEPSQENTGEQTFEVTISYKSDNPFISSSGWFDGVRVPRRTKSLDQSDTIITDVTVVSPDPPSLTALPLPEEAALITASGANTSTPKNSCIDANTVYNPTVVQQQHYQSKDLHSQKQGNDHIYLDLSKINFKSIKRALKRAEVYNGIVTVVDHHHGSIVDTDSYSEGSPSLDRLDNKELKEPPSSDMNGRIDPNVEYEDIEAFNSTMRYAHLRQLALRLFMKDKSDNSLNRSNRLDSGTYQKRLPSSGHEDLLFKNGSDAPDYSLKEKRPLNLSCGHFGPSNNTTQQKSDYNFDFLKKKRAPSRVSTPQNKTRNDLDNGGFVKFGILHSSMSTPPIVLDLHSGIRNELKFDVETNRGFNLDNSVACSDSARCLGNGGSLTPASLEHSVSRLDEKKYYTSEHGNSRRGLLVDNINSFDSICRLKQYVKQNKLFDAPLYRNDCSEIWGSFLNVITLKKNELGHGSFSTVSAAFVRVHPSLSTSHSNCENICAANCKEIDRMNDIISKHCETCKETKTLYGAIKWISDAFSQSRFQYIREKEMMLHFNGHVLKPLACRVTSDSAGNTFYQLLMNKARGDLLKLLSGLVLHRTGEYRLLTGNAKDTVVRMVGLSEQETKFLFYQILSGIAFIQMCFQGNIHRHSDIKLANVLVFCEECDIYDPLKWRLCLADFGCSILMYPTLQLEGAANLLFNSDMQHKLFKEWVSQLQGQLYSFVRGTVRYNAPEALSYDGKGSRRSNRNQNLLSAYLKNYSYLLSSKSLKDKVVPKIWGQKDINVKQEFYQMPSSSLISGSSKEDAAEYYMVDMRADMWSAGIILAEMAKFATDSPLYNYNGAIEESLRLSLDCKIHNISNRIRMTLGKGLFCKNSQSQNSAKNIKLQDALPTSRRQYHQHPCKISNTNQATDDELNKSLALEIALKCNVDYNIRKTNLKAQYCSWERPQFSADFWDLLSRLLAYEPGERLIAAQALGHEWFNSLDFDALDRMSLSINNHLSMEHFYSLGTSLGTMSCSSTQDSSPLNVVNREALLDYGNSDFCFESLSNYAKVSQSPNAWYAGPLHYRFHELRNEPSADTFKTTLCDFVAKICAKEALVLEFREEQLFGARGFVLSRLMAIKDKYKLSWAQMVSARTSHLLGKALLNIV